MILQKRTDVLRYCRKEKNIVNLLSALRTNLYCGIASKQLIKAPISIFKDEFARVAEVRGRLTRTYAKNKEHIKGGIRDE